MFLFVFPLDSAEVENVLLFLILAAEIVPFALRRLAHDHEIAIETDLFARSLPLAARLFPHIQVEQFLDHLRTSRLDRIQLRFSLLEFSAIRLEQFKNLLCSRLNGSGSGNGRSLARIIEISAGIVCVRLRGSVRVRHCRFLS